MLWVRDLNQADPCEMVEPEITDIGKYSRLPILGSGSEPIVVVLPQLSVLGLSPSNPNQTTGVIWHMVPADLAPDPTFAQGCRTVPPPLCPPTPKDPADFNTSRIPTFRIIVLDTTLCVNGSHSI